jgi:glycyl-tRNA synthetase
VRTVPDATVTMDKIVSLAKRRGFIFQSSEIYGGQGGAWDYGPLGVELKNNIKRAWWRANVLERADMVGLDAAILMHPQTWVASGHVGHFTDPMVDCRACKHRFRADHIVVGVGVINRQVPAVMLSRIGMTDDEILSELQAVEEQRDLHFENTVVAPLNRIVGGVESVPCPNCGVVALTEPRMFNLMFKTFVGPVEEDADQVYLRPETAQGIFVNFANVVTSMRRKLPFGIAQIGKAFRNEITPGNFTFRSREFEQMELEFFCKPGTDDEWHQRWMADRLAWYGNLGIDTTRLRLRPHDPGELAHYAKGTSDIEYLFPMGWSELEGIANRTDYDLKQHQEFSGQSLTYFDEESGQHIVPYVIEPSAGADRAALAFLLDAYHEEEVPAGEGKTEVRTVLKLHPAIAPVKVAVLPLSRNEKLTPTAQAVYTTLRSRLRDAVVQYDDSQSIGRRYRRQDEIGTPFCVTVDFETVENDQAVTIRERDSMTQERVAIADLVPALRQKLGWE